MWDLVPRPGIEPTPPALEVQSVNHWTSKEVPKAPFKVSLSNSLITVSLS